MTQKMKRKLKKNTHLFLFHSPEIQRPKLLRMRNQRTGKRNGIMGTGSKEQNEKEWERKWNERERKWNERERKWNERE
jgi:hypothetical protein